MCFGDKQQRSSSASPLYEQKKIGAVQTNALETCFKIKSIKPKTVCSKRVKYMCSTTLFRPLLKLIWYHPTKYYFNPLILKEIVLVARRTIKTPIFGTADTMCSQYILTLYTTTHTTSKLSDKFNSMNEHF